MKETVTARAVLTNDPGNKRLFAEEQVAEQYSIIVVGEPGKKDAEGKAKYKYMQTSAPTEDAIKAGVTKSRYFRTAFKKAGDRQTLVTTSGDEKVFIRGSKKAIFENTFENVQPNLFVAINQAIKDGHFTELGNDKEGNMQIELNIGVFGKRIVAVTPKYKLYTRKDGKLQPLMAGTYDPQKQKYVPKHAVKDSIIMFVDEEDLDNLLEVVSKRVERDVMPFLAERITTIKETVTKVETEVKEESTTQEEDLEDPDSLNIEEGEDEEEEETV